MIILYFDRCLIAHQTIFWGKSRNHRIQNAQGLNRFFYPVLLLLAKRLAVAGRFLCYHPLNHPGWVKQIHPGWRYDQGNSNKQRSKENLMTTKAYKGMAMEGPIAAWYAKITQKDIRRHKLGAERWAKKIAQGSRVLEIAPGPGYFCIELARLGQFQITGLDISQSFVDIARKNAAAAGIQAEFRQGDVANMPFEDASFDFLFCQAAFKNFTQPVKAITEMYRVLLPGGMGVILDLRSDASQTEIEQEIENMDLGRIDEFLTRWTFRNVLLKNAYRIDEIQAMAAQTPFEKCTIVKEGVGFQVRLEKNN